MRAVFFSVAPPPTGAGRVRQDSQLSGEEEVFDSEHSSSKPTTPKDKDAPVKLVPAPPPKENIWEKRKGTQVWFMTL